MASFSVILLAGGLGTRMKHTTPKQFLTIGKKPIARYSYDLLAALPEVGEIVVVCPQQYRVLFREIPGCKLQFAHPGKRRQDSLRNGFEQLTTQAEWVCVHDAARPCVDLESVLQVMRAGKKHGAASLGIPAKNTIKQIDKNGFVVQTLERDMLWEIHTPQVLRREYIEEGLALTKEQGTTVTDDVALAEILGKPVKLVRDNETNIKLTTPEDLPIIEERLALVDQLTSTNL